MAVDMFLKLADIKGECKDSAHKEEIDVESFSWGMTQSGSMHAGGGGGSGKVNVQDVSLTKYVDKASPNLMLACCNGTHYPEAVLAVRKAGEDPLEYLKIKMSEVMITSVQTGGGGGEDRLTETLSLNFAKVEVEYQPQGKDGKADGGAIAMGWNIEENIKV
ncbi:MAG: Hcp family type VI secretion system effector [Gammaproteobacteria bacterium]